MEQKTGWEPAEAGLFRVYVKSQLCTKLVLSRKLLVAGVRPVSVAPSLTGQIVCTFFFTHLFCVNIE